MTYIPPTLYAVITAGDDPATLHSIGWPKKPELAAIESLVVPLLCERNGQSTTDMERVRWFYNDTYMDLFVDEIGGPAFRNLPVNNFATQLYHNNIMCHMSAIARERHLAPIYGAAVVFFRPVWF